MAVHTNHYTHLEIHTKTYEIGNHLKEAEMSVMVVVNLEF